MEGPTRDGSSRRHRAGSVAAHDLAAAHDLVHRFPLPRGDGLGKRLMELEGIVVVELAKAHEIQAAVALHPGPITVDDIKEVKCPISILGAEIDHMSPPELVKQFEQVLSANSGVAHFVKIFPGVAHGWSVRYSDDDQHAVKSAEEALGDTIDWFNKNLK